MNYKETRQQEYRNTLKLALQRARRTKSPVYVYDLGADIFALGNWNDQSAQLAAVAVVLPNAITLERK